MNRLISAFQNKNILRQKVLTNRHAVLNAGRRKSLPEKTAVYSEKERKNIAGFIRMKMNGIDTMKKTGL